MTDARFENPMPLHLGSALFILSLACSQIAAVAPASAQLDLSPDQAQQVNQIEKTGQKIKNEMVVNEILTRLNDADETCLLSSLPPLTLITLRFRLECLERIGERQQHIIRSIRYDDWDAIGPNGVVKMLRAVDRGFSIYPKAFYIPPFRDRLDDSDPQLTIVNTVPEGALHQYSLRDFLSLIKATDPALREKWLGLIPHQYFCDDHRVEYEELLELLDKDSVVSANSRRQESRWTCQGK